MRKLSLIAHLKQRLLGKPLDSAGIEGTKLAWWWGLPTLAGNAISSVAYSVEEILLVLIPVLGFAAILLTPNIAIPILILLLVLVFSYSQIIKHYPQGAGAYQVASDSLGKRPAIFAAASLIIDYTLTVAISISAAVAALTSAFPQLTPYRIFVAILGVILVTLFNLRGSQESSRVFGVPTYAFVFVMGALIIVGLFQLVTGNLVPTGYVHTIPAQVDPIVPLAMVFLMLRAFASGSMALSGIDAVSNSMATLREPRQKNAQIVLFSLAGIIMFLFGGSIILAHALEVAPILDGSTGMPMAGSLTVIAQMGQAVFGAESLLFFILQISTALILFLAAHSAYSDMPNLLSVLARDNFAPRQFSERGARLTLSNGILFLAFAASGLIIIFHAEVHAIIPLYCVGVFLSFTISQLGMCRKWIREKEPLWQKRMVINAVGTAMTGIAAIVVFIAKFAAGAWILAIAIPVLCFIMYRIHRHYADYDRSLQITRADYQKHYHPSETSGKIACYIPVHKMTRAILKNINFANELSNNVTLLHVARDADAEQEFRRQYRELGVSVPLVVLKSPYRDLATPIVNFLDDQEARLESGHSIAVVMTRITFDHYYDNLLHNQTAYFLTRALRDYKDTATIAVPYHMNLQKIRDTYVSADTREKD
ncbi:MAG: APC family permease [Coriobacteriia bacterium]|nr:APC family permease [Coriobacteriia bacterium]